MGEGLKDQLLGVSPMMRTSTIFFHCWLLCLIPFTSGERISLDIVEGSGDNTAEEGNEITNNLIIDGVSKETEEVIIDEGNGDNTIEEDNENTKNLIIDGVSKETEEVIIDEDEITTTSNPSDNLDENSDTKSTIDETDDVKDMEMNSSESED